MQKKITMTTLLKKPKEIRNYAKKGFVLKVFFNKDWVFSIVPAKKINLEPKKEKYKAEDLPSFDLNLPVNLSKKEIYEKFGK
jgi:hypothetical protein